MKTDRKTRLLFVVVACGVSDWVEVLKIGPVQCLEFIFINLMIRRRLTIRPDSWTPVRPDKWSPIRSLTLFIRTY